MMTIKAGDLDVGAVVTLDDGESWHTVKDVETTETVGDDPIAVTIITTEEGKKVWEWADVDVIVRV